MDRLAYLASAGAKQLLQRQSTIAHNLANANTTGFRADLDAFRALPVQGQGPGTRVFVADSTPGFDNTPGTLQVTGRNLDVAIEGEGFFVVEARDGGEAYTRAGSLQVGADGILRTSAGQPLQGDGGPITIPENARVAIGHDGTVSAIAGNDNKSVNVLGRIKLVNPPVSSRVKGGDGLLRATEGESPASDANVRLVDGTLEGSNVNPVEALVSMIAVARLFETQMRLMTSAEQNASAGNKLLAATA